MLEPLFSIQSFLIQKTLIYSHVFWIFIQYNNKHVKSINWTEKELTYLNAACIQEKADMENRVSGLLLTCYDSIYALV